MRPRRRERKGAKGSGRVNQGFQGVRRQKTPPRPGAPPADAGGRRPPRAKNAPEPRDNAQGCGAGLAAKKRRGSAKAHAATDAGGEPNSVPLSGRPSRTCRFRLKRASGPTGTAGDDASCISGSRTQQPSHASNFMTFCKVDSRKAGCHERTRLAKAAPPRRGRHRTDTDSTRGLTCRNVPSSFA